MGLSYLAFACSIEELQSVYSSRDEALYTRMITSDDSAVRHYLDLDKAARASDGIVPDNLAPLHELFVGAALTRHKPHKYGYALVACAYALGAFLGESMGGYGRQMEAMRALEEMGESDELLPDMTVEWPIPNMPILEDWPMYFGVPAAEVTRRAAAMKELMGRISPVYRERATERAAEFIDDIAGFYEACAAMKRDLIVVSH